LRQSQIWAPIDTGYQFVNCSAFFVPKGTPPEIVAKLNSGFNKALRSPALLVRLNELSFQPADGPPEAAAQLLNDDLALWGPDIAQTSRLRAQVALSRSSRATTMVHSIHGSGEH
jgi:tripartite-type tricarboxylate transporter receptor subunit TctC